MNFWTLSVDIQFSCPFLPLEIACISITEHVYFADICVFYFFSLNFKLIIIARWLVYVQQLVCFSTL